MKSKFDNFRDEENYYKLLIDFRAYDNDGNFMPQGPVIMNFLPDKEFRSIVKNSLEEQQKNEDRLAEDLKDEQNSLYKEVKETLSNSGTIRHSLTVDSEGKELTEGQKEYFKNSMVVDENGRLKVMYHGSHNDFGFTVFDANHSYDGRSLFFTSKRKIAQSYASSDTKFKAKESYTIDDLHNLVDNFFTQIEKDGDVYKINQYTYGPKLVSTDFEGNFEELRDYALDMYGDTSGNGYYEVYLNITNPLVIDADGSYWDELPNLADINGDAWTTRDASEYALNNGYDGVIFNNIVDNPNGSYEEDTVVIAFYSNQVKSVDNLNPTDNEDIRYSISLRDKDNFKRFSNEINNYLDNPNPKQENLLVMDYTPKLLQRIGLDNKKILMTIGHFKTITSAKQNKRDHNHNLKIMEVKKAPLILEHPAMILNSINPKSYNSVVVVSDILDYKGDPIIIALSSNYNGLYINQISANKLASMYGRKNFKDFLENVYLMNGIMYVDKKRSQNLHDRLRVQFPAVVTSKVSFNKILHTIDEYVNGISVKIGEVLNDKVAFSLNIDEDFEEIFGGESSSNILDEGLKALKDVEVNSEAIKKIANGLIREYGSTYDKDTFAGNLEKIFAYIKNTDHLNYQDMLEIISDVAMPVIREATEKDPESVRLYNQFIEDIGSVPIRLTEQQEAEVEYAFGSYNEFRKMIMPLRISRNGVVDLDQIWSEIVDKYGYALSYDISPAEQPIALYDLYQGEK